MAQKPPSIVIAACSKYVCFPAFEKVAEETGMNPFLISLANIREYCAWVHSGQGDAASAKAKRLLYSAIEKAKTLEPVPVEEYKVNEHALVVGAGIAGIQTSLELVKQGFRVCLVEKSPIIGGKTYLLYSIYPTNCSATCLLSPMITEVATNDKINIRTLSELTEAKQLPGKFEVTIQTRSRYVDPSKCIACGLCASSCPVEVPSTRDPLLGSRKAVYIPYPQAQPRSYLIDSETCLYFKDKSCSRCKAVCPANAIDFEQKPSSENMEVGTIIVATGFEEFNPHDLAIYGHGKFKDVLTQFQVSKLLDPLGPTKGQLLRPSDDKPPKHVVMVQCVGSRDPETNLYCSQYCCMGAIKNASFIKMRNPSAEIIVLYKDIRAAGKGFEEYYVETRDKLGVKFIAGDVTRVFQEPGSDSISVEYETPSGQKEIVKTDLVTLSCGMVPSEDNSRLAETLGIKVGTDGFYKELDEKVSPVETEIPGIYLCGTSQAPRNLHEAVTHAYAAALQASLRMTGTVTKALVVPKVFEEICSGCGICRQVCPFEAIVMEQKNGKEIAKVDEIACRGCGLCAGICPIHALDLINYEHDQISRQIRAILTDRIEGPHPIILAFCCEACGITALDITGSTKKQYPAGVIPIHIPCSSRVTISHVTEALSLGAKGVLILGCLKERCHYGDGITKAEMKTSVLRKILHDFNIPQNCIQVLGVSGTMIQEFVATAWNLAALAGSSEK